MGKHWCMDMKLGDYGLETRWVGSILDAEIFEGHFKVIQGHPRSNG